MSDAVRVLASMTIGLHGQGQRLLSPFRYDKVENSMIRNHKLSALLTTIPSDSVVTPQYLSVATQSATRAADYAPSTSLPTCGPLYQRGVVDLADGGAQITPAPTRSLAENAGRLGGGRG